VTIETVEQRDLTGQRTSAALIAQVRGSTLLLAGRGASLVLNLASQILTIRYLTQLDYGVLAYAFSLVELASVGASFSLDKTLARFGAIYHEQRDTARFSGALLLSFGVVLILGLAFAGLLCAPGYWLSSGTSTDTTTGSILMVLALLVPINALSGVTVSSFTVLGHARIVMLRKQLLGPGLKFAFVIVAVSLDGGLTAIAWAWLIAGVCGLAADCVLMRRHILSDGMVQQFTAAAPKLPMAAFFSYSWPLLISDSVFLVRGAVVVILLGWLDNTVAAGTFRAALPLARLNELVTANFVLMFTPIVSRLFAQDRIGELAETHRRNTVWVKVLSFPIFATCVLLAGPLVVLMFGAEYAESADVLAVLAVGYFVQAAFGLNSRLLKVLGCLRRVLCLDLLAAVFALALCLVLIPRFGAIGAAYAVAASTAAHAVLREVVMPNSIRQQSQLSSARVESTVTLALAAGVVVVRVVANPGVALGSLLVVVLTGLVIAVNHRSLGVESMFPELHRIRTMVVGRFVEK